MSSNWGKLPRYGDFEIVGARENQPRLIGEGSFGKTFEAVRKDNIAGGVIEEFVAVKVLNPKLLASESKRFQFVQELVALTKFKHSNLIHYIRCGEESGEVYYAMELCRGGDLAQLSRRFGPLPERVVALIGLQVAAGLREVHIRHRLVHRDIKPSNIMLVDEIEPGLSLHHLSFRFEEQDSLCRIVDFGLVDFTLNAQDTQQRFVGSPMYASPDQIREQPVDGRSDIYSLGMTLWYLLQGKGPLLNPSGEELKDMRQAMVAHTVPEEHDAAFPKNLSPAFHKILTRMVAKRPEQRFSTATELQTALRQYLSSSTEAAPATQPASFTITRLNEPLETAFTLEGTFPSRLSHRAYLAVEKRTGTRVKLDAMADANRNDAATLQSLATHLSELAQLSRDPAFPVALLPIREVIWASDILACTEEMVSHVALTDVLRARAAIRRNLGFSEAAPFLRSIAEALDFMLEHGRETIFLPCEEIWLTGASVVAATPGDQRALTQPLGEWGDLQVHFSMLCLPPSQQQAAVEMPGDAHQTMSGSMQMSDADLHPVPAFVRLVYRILNGAEVAAATAFTPNAYVPAVTLSHASNNLLRDLLCRQRQWSNATSVLRELCSNEGVVWHGSASPSAGAAGRSTMGSMQTVGLGSAMGTSAFSTVNRVGNASGSVAGGTASGSTAGFGTRAGDSTAGSATGSSTGGSFGSFETVRVDRPTTSIEVDKICEVVRPGIVRSPFDPQQREQIIPAEQWVPSGRVRCQFSQKLFRLPRRLDHLVAQVLVPGVIQSPYAAPGSTQQISWDVWNPGGELVCSESGRRITLPLDLPLPEGVLPPDNPGVIISPFDRSTPVQVAPDQWERGAEVICPASGMHFALPGQLPALRALADSANPGVLASPYAPAVRWQIPPGEWTAGRSVLCPVTQKPLTLPYDVERWPAPATLIDGARRLISNPFRPGSEIQVPASAWTSRGRTLCPQTGRTILLPADLPPLTCELVSGRPGEVRSPFTGETITLSPRDWQAGANVTCPTTRQRFVLPSDLPEWVVPGDVSGLAPGKIRSPYDSGAIIDVQPERWTPNQVLACPVTGRRFSLPAELPLLVGSVQNGQPGRVQSPYSGQWQDVPLDEWTSGNKLSCATTGRPFALPAQLEEWLTDGTWVSGIPGRIASPFRGHAEVDIAPGDWKSGGRLTCPRAKRPFRIPAEEPFPTLDLERAAVQFALAEPDSTEEAAAENLSRAHGQTSAAQIQAIWKRHGLSDIEARRRQVETAEVLQEEPGVVRSPYGSHPHVSVPPATWIMPRAGLICPETGKRFVLPEKLPPLVASEKPGEPGTVISPFSPEQPFQVNPADWKAGASIRCAHTGQPLHLPASLSPWSPVGTLANGASGTVVSPFGNRRAMDVEGANWYPGAAVICRETGWTFALPASLPSLVGKLEGCEPGSVSSPYAPNCKVNVPPANWRPGAEISCPQTGRTFLLPADLPPLVGETVANRTGVARSPYNGETLEISFADWRPGATVRCPKTGALFALPASLPEWVLEGNTENLRPGKVRSPYAPRTEVSVRAEEWAPNQLVECPATGRRFRLPAELPLLEGGVTPGRPGSVISPFSGKAQNVSLDDWKPGHKLECGTTNHPFVLPPDLEEWLVDGQWVPGYPGWLRSPFRPNPEVEVPADSWKPGGPVVCPATRRRFRIPAEYLFPSLDLEKAAFEYALTEPETNEHLAAEALRPAHPGVTPAQVQSIWERHGLGTEDQRRTSVETGELIPGRSGRARSPYGNHPEVEVSPEQWMELRPTLRCPETGRLFTLPPERPALEAGLIPDEPGAVISPFAPDQPIQLNPDEWVPGHAIICPHSRHPFVLPPRLPEWNPEGGVHEGQPGTVFSPFGRKLAMKVRPADWAPGGAVTCLETGYAFKLPHNLPPMVGSVKAGTVGQALSPYSPDTEVQVPRKLWAPGRRVTCPRTGRDFLLPTTLPPWPGASFPWALVAVPLVLVVAAAGIYFSPLKDVILRKPPVGPDGPKGTPPKKQAPPSLAVIGGGIRIPDWTRAEAPQGMQWSCLGQQGTPKVEKAGDQVYTLSFDLPSEAAARPECEVQISVPGWVPSTMTLRRDEKGVYNVYERQILQRQTVQVPLDIPGNVSDYDSLIAIWKDHLPDEPQATPPALGSISVNVAARTEPIPTGVYEVKLLSRNPAIRPAPYGEIRVSAHGHMSPLELPPSIKGDYWGLVKYNTLGQGYFIVISAEARLARLEARLLQFEKGRKEFRSQDTKPYIGDVWDVKSGATLEMKQKGQYLLHFSCPILGVRLDWTLSNSGGGRYLMKPSFPKENDDLEGLLKYSLDHLNDQAAEVRRMGKEAASHEYHESDLNNFFASGFDVRQLQRYKDLTRAGDLSAYVNFMRTNIASHPDIGVDMYPPGPLVRSENGGEWDLEPKKDN